MRARFASSLVIALALAACSGGAPEQAGAGGPPLLVEAITVRAQEVPNIIELPGRIAAVRNAEVRARADGIIDRKFFTEGADVVAGQALFRIDPTDLQAQVQQAQATLSRLEAARVNAAQVVKRYAPLVSERAVSGQENDQAVATLRQAAASAAEARAALTRARLQLSYTTVRAPISGRVGQAQVTEGALVSVAQATLLTTVEQPTPIYAEFEQSNTAMLDLRRNGQTGAGMKPLGEVEVRLVLANGQEYAPVGRLNFAAPAVDPQTGSQTLRAVFPNGERLLMPGQFVRGRISIGTLPNGIVLPARAIQFGDRGATVMVVAQDGSATPRPVELSGQTGTGWVVKSGLKAGERVITDGWQKIQQPGMKVQVKGDKPPAAQSQQPAQQPAKQ